MSYTEKWNEICFLLSKNLPSDLSEADFGQKIIQALRILDWKEYKGEIEKEHSFQFGSANKLRPDFIIKFDDKRLFVIEIKLPNIPINSTFQRQLFSYMRQLKLEYGILIGQGIQIFYDGNLVNQDDPILLDTFQFTPDSEKGEKFVELFSKESYNLELLNTFTLNSLKNINRKEDYKKLTKKILSVDFKERLNELIIQDFLNEYDGELIDNVLQELIISIYPKQKIENENIKLPQVLNNQTLKYKNSNLNDTYQKPIGKFVKEKLQKLIEFDLINYDEIQKLLDKDYSKLTFDIQYPFLQNSDVKDEEILIRYWKNPFEIKGSKFFVCSQWYETIQNNDRPYFEKWYNKLMSK